MLMSRWIVIIIIVAIYCVAMTPIDKWIRTKTSNKYIALGASFAIGFAILFSLYVLADLAGLF